MKNTTLTQIIFDILIYMLVLTFTIGGYKVVINKFIELKTTVKLLKFIFIIIIKIMNEQIVQQEALEEISFLFIS